MKTNLILFVLALLLAIPVTLTVRAERANFTEIEDIPLLFDGFNKASVAFLRVSQGWNDPVDPKNPPPEPQKPVESVLVRREPGDKWSLADGDLAGLKVRTEMVDLVLDNVGRVRRDERSVLRAGASAEEIAQFGLDKAQGVLIAAYDVNQRLLAELVVGKDVSGGQWGKDVVAGRFVRAKDKESVLVYEVESWRLGVDRNEWVDKAVYRVDPTKVVGFAFDNPKGSFEVTKPRADVVEWTRKRGPDGTAAVRQGEMQTLIQKVTYVDAVSVLSQLQPAVLKAKGLDLAQIGLEPPEHAITLTLEGGDTVDLKIGRKLEGKNELYALSNRLPFLFTIADWALAPIDSADPKGLFDTDGK